MAILPSSLHLPSLLSCLVLLLIPTAAAQLSQTCLNNAKAPLPAKTIFQFTSGGAGTDANFTFFENVVARANGDLLVTMAVPNPTVFLLRNAGSACPTFTPALAAVPGVNGTNGIAEIATRPDVFAVIAGNLTLSGDPANGVPKSWSVWEIDMTADRSSSSNSNSTVDCNAPAAAPPVVSARKIADFPMAPRLNGIAAVPGTSAMLVGDSELGVAFRLDTATGNITTALDLPAMKPAPNAGSVDDALGLNGLKVSPLGPGGGNGSMFLYFTNAANRTINRVAVLPDGSGAVPGAAVESIASVPQSGWMDDLDVRQDGSLWVTTNVSRDPHLVRYNIVRVCVRLLIGTPPRHLRMRSWPYSRVLRTRRARRPRPRPSSGRQWWRLVAPGT